jgi:hypothetical protein
VTTRQRLPDFGAVQALLFARATAGDDHPHLAAALTGPPGVEALDVRLGRILDLVLEGLLPEAR